MAFAKALYTAYKEWCETNGEHVETQRRFGMRLTERGLRREKVGGVFRWYGIGLRHDGPGPSELKGPDTENTSFAGKSAPAERPSGLSGPENTKRSSKNRVREGFGENSPDGPNGPDSPDVGEGYSQKTNKENSVSSVSCVSEEFSPALTTTDVLQVLEDPSTGANKNAPLYSADEIALEYLVRSVLFARGIPTEDWQRYTGVVEEAFKEWRERKS